MVGVVLMPWQSSRKLTKTPVILSNARNKGPLTMLMTELTCRIQDCLGQLRGGGGDWINDEGYPAGEWIQWNTIRQKCHFPITIFGSTSWTEQENVFKFSAQEAKRTTLGRITRYSMCWNPCTLVPFAAAYLRGGKNSLGQRNQNVSVICGLRNLFFNLPQKGFLDFKKMTQKF